MTNAIGLYEQAKWEQAGVDRAAERYRDAAESADVGALPSDQWLLRDIVPALIITITALQKQMADTLASGARSSRAAWPLQLFIPADLAIIAVVGGLGSVRTPGGPLSTMTGVARYIAEAARDQLEYRRWAALQVAENKLAVATLDWEHVDVLAQMRRRYPTMDRRVWKRWRVKVDAAREQWDQATQVEFGSALITALCNAAPQHFTTELRRDSGRTVRHLIISPETTDRLADIETRSAVARPLRIAMLIPPIPWAYEPTGATNPAPCWKAPTGGYLIHRLDMIRTGHQAHTKALDGAVSQLDLDAVNAVQATPWRINQWILDVMTKAWAGGLRLGGLEVGEPFSLPARHPDTLWDALSPEAKSAHAGKRREIHRLNASITGRSQLVLDCLSVASELRDLNAIYYPHSKDFRHRIYCAATRGPNPQGSDIAKSLIMFAEGKPLGDDGFFWLCVRAANCWGYDKATLEDRVAWALAHLTDFSTSATAPLTSTWWTQAAEPWSFLATCFEITMAHSSCASPAAFVSHLPIPLDGSCNGLQHLAAMGLDPTGARATNLTPDPVRQDIYQDVASMVTSLVERDALAGLPVASMWTTAVSRKTVKRAVMTTPYGVTDRGIRDQLIADGMIPNGGTELHVGELAVYMTTKIVEALTGTVSSARAIMGWLQDTAARLARAGLPFDWTTPSGSRVRQAYHVTTVQHLTGCLVGQVSLEQENPDGGLVVRKQSAGSAPNYVHSFDAAHLTLTVNACAYAGIGSFAMIHDSYGTHAADTTRLGVELRQAFVDIYRENWPMKLKTEIAGYAPHVVIDDPPARGNFDISQVLEAAYFFS